MIKKLKTKFITLAMISLTLLLAAIVAGMNIINYNEVISDADVRLDVIEENFERFPQEDGPFGRGSRDDMFFGKGGKGGHFMTMDEAEEARFFTVITDEKGTFVRSKMDRIAAVGDDQAKEYAEKALASGKGHGFIDEFRYSVNYSDGEQIVTFLDCGRVLDSFRDFLRASILMSLAGLLLVFGIITYFAGRIVKPVAESYEKQRRFITDAGHEIKTPLAIIKANLDVIELDPESTDESLKEIGNQVDRLSGLTSDLVYLSKMEETDTRPIATDVPISELAEEAVSSFEALAKDNGKSIEANIEPMLSVKGNIKEVEKMISILMENAVKYSTTEDAIKLSLRREGKNAALIIANKTTKPINKESIEHVFDRFYRMDESRNSETGGYGIGLSMASAIVTACGGKISAETSDGTDFIVKAVLPS